MLRSGRANGKNYHYAEWRPIKKQFDMKLKMEDPKWPTGPAEGVPNIPSSEDAGFPKITKVFGEPAQAIKVFEEYNKIAFSDEIQQMFNERLDFTKPDVIEKVQSVWLDASYLALEHCGFEHLKPMFGPGKITDIIHVMFLAYHDCPEVLKLGAYIQDPYVDLPAPSVVDIGSGMPNLNLVSLVGKTVGLSDLHINKDRPMMIMASSAS
ncbi:uncharacterized protein LOC100893585 isoform X1 [Strongylocentrotus purpuratus]|uniref:Uncharacterized protein n=2 Tax=Strongylocentrotus purpuratus TaxID=7668 RepID=A0A7M7PHT6_STRPU|nr:uncharacterized protein LOC100893585 isoform X1 [Strongylocentrotus purpuratus]